MIKLFDDIGRSNKDLKSYSESSYSYLNNSARKECFNIREILESWFYCIPANFKKDIKNTFISLDKRKHLSAFFEIYLFNLFKQIGMNILFHPRINSDKKTPDFLIYDKYFNKIYVEATVVSDSDTKTSSKNIENQILDFLNTIHSEYYFIGLEINFIPNTQVKLTKIKNFIESKLKNLDYNLLNNLYDKGGQEALPKWNFKDGLLDITFFPILKKREYAGSRSKRIVGLQMHDVEVVNTKESIRKSIINKARKYKNLDANYIIALNVVKDLGMDDDDVMNALFGDEQVHFIETEKGIEYHSTSRKRNGALWGSKGPKNTHVSGILIFNNLNPWSISKTNPVLWHNPFTKQIIEKNIFPFYQFLPDNKTNKYIQKKGKPIYKILGISESWPFE